MKILFLFSKSLVGLLLFFLSVTTALGFPIFSNIDTRNSDIPKKPNYKKDTRISQKKVSKDLIKHSSNVDPIRFSIVSSKQNISAGEEIEITITAQLMGISPNLMYYLPGANSYTLKIITPDGFQPTNGDFGESLSGELTFPNKTQITYHLKGYFVSVQEQNCFRLL